ncbi:MAG: PadR family transcriptional regulator [Gemmatimonadetes bacterium]|nr:PadR family transcriptional regulator [Gemmatimonadota bacterium]
MSLDHILLGLLREPATGYDLKGAFSESVRHFWSAELSQIYPTLKRLEKQRMLRSRVEPSPRGPDRRIYSLTDEGRTELLTWLRDGPAIGTERFAYLAQLYFMDAAGDLDHTRAFMTALRDNLSRWLGQLRAIERDIIADHGDAPERYGDAGFHQFATLRMGIHSIGSKVVWCDETLAAIDRRLESRHRCGAAEGAESNEPEAASS